MKLHPILFAGIITGGFSILQSEAVLSSDPSTQEIEKLKRTLAVEQERTKELEQMAAKKSEQENLRQQIAQERQEQQALTQQPEPEKKKHGVEKRAAKIGKWAKKHHI